MLGRFEDFEDHSFDINRRDARRRRFYCDRAIAKGFGVKA
jgi:hypothetical protein